MPRLFTAIEVPDEIRDELYRLRMPLPGARWMKPESYHITLRFAGDIGNVAAREFAANLSRIEPDGFELRLSGLGAFGGDDPHAIWAGVELTPQLEDLARAHEKAARNAGLAPETRAFKPHVTLARLKHSNSGGRGALLDTLQRLPFRTFLRPTHVADVIAPWHGRRAIWRRRPVSDARDGVSQRGRRRYLMMLEIDDKMIQDGIVNTTLPVASRRSRTFSASPILSKS